MVMGIRFVNTVLRTFSKLGDLRPLAQILTSIRLVWQLCRGKSLRPGGTILLPSAVP